MARLIPKVDPHTIANSGERAVAVALKEQLPDHCLVYHSYPWLRRQQHEQTGKEYLQPGETDFIIVHPDKGVMILEVKAGALTYQPDTGAWTRSWGLDPGDPFAQAERNKYALWDRIKAHPHIGDGPTKFTVGHAVALPDSRVTGPLPANVDRAILLDADALRDLNGALNRAYDAWCRVRNPQPLDQSQLDAIVESISPAMHFTPVLWRTIEDQEARLQRLTQEQARILTTLNDRRRAAIQGVAGLGKTILAIAQAQRFARQGKRVLLVCFNRPLADWIASEQPDQYRDLLHVNTYHGLCQEMCRVAGIRFLVRPNDPDFWSYEAPELLEQAAGQVASEHGFDAIVVDEGQDFEAFWWTGLEQLYRDGRGPLYVFYDPRQNIYVREPSLPPELGEPFNLPINCRNTRTIAAFCSNIVGIDPQVIDDAPQGVVPDVVEKHDPRDVIREAQRTVQDWCLRDRGGLQPRQVAILTAFSDHSAWPAAFGNIKLVDDFDQWRRNEGILISTARRFKGLEADALILAGMPEPDTRHPYSTADHYVASSRAKHLLKIVFDRSL